MLAPSQAPAPVRLGHEARARVAGAGHGLGERHAPQFMVLILTDVHQAAPYHRLGESYVCLVA